MGFDTSVTLLDQNQQMIIASQAGSATNPDDWIDQHLTAGTYFLGVQGKDGSAWVRYRLQPVRGDDLPIDRATGGSGRTAVISGDFNGEDSPTWRRPTIYTTNPGLRQRG